MINIFQPSLGEEERDAVREVFKSNWIGRGPKVGEFEKKFAEYQGVEPSQMISTTCASEGLFAIMEILGLSPDDEVIIPTVGFVAKASAVCSVGAKPVFCDVNSHSLNSSLEDIEKALTNKTKVVIVNHYGGYPVEIEKIQKFCTKNNLVLIEDAACAIGSSVTGKKIGTYGDFSVWSFDSMKILVTGDGGMIYCKEEAMAKKMREHLYLGLIEGKTSGLEKSKSTKDRWWEYEISGFGRRAIMNDLTASIGLVQLSKLPENLKRRQQIATRYSEAFRSIPALVIPPQKPEIDEVTHYLYWVQLDKRDELAHYLMDKGIYTTYRYWPLHRVAKFGWTGASLPGSEKATDITLNIPCHQSLSDKDVEYVISCIKNFMSGKS